MSTTAVTLALPVSVTVQRRVPDLITLEYGPLPKEQVAVVPAPIVMLVPPANQDHA
jgi:hypothetical protein